MRSPALFLALCLFPTTATPSLPGQEKKQEPAADKTGHPGSTAIEAVRAQLDALKADYEKRIKQLESQIEQLQLQMLRAEPEPEPAPAVQPPARVPTMAGAFNPAIGVVGNFVARADNQKVYGEDGTRIDNRFNFREAEIDLRVPVDPYADGVLITAFGADVPGHYKVEVEEGYVNIKKLPFSDHMPLGLKFKVGRFRPTFGKTNILHTHDTPQTFRPLPIQEFLGEEGFIQSGVAGDFFIPTPWDEKSSIDVTLQALTGGDIAISPEPGRVSYLGHARWFRTFADTHDVELGWSSYGRPGGDVTRGVNLQGFDFTYRWKPLRQGEWRSLLVGGELLFARRAYPEAAQSPDVARALEGHPLGEGKPLGFTVFSQWQFDRRKYAGVRYDRTDVVSSPDLRRQSVTPYFSYYFSEFLRFRLNYEHRWSDLATENRRNSVFAELNFVFGAHPPEPFWVSK